MGPQAMAKLPEMEAAMIEHYQQNQERAGAGIELLPGVLDLLKALQVPQTCRHQDMHRPVSPLATMQAHFRQHF